MKIWLIDLLLSLFPAIRDRVIHKYEWAVSIHVCSGSGPIYESSIARNRLHNDLIYRGQPFPPDIWVYL